jgi:hypothetical protein
MTARLKVTVIAVVAATVSSTKAIADIGHHNASISKEQAMKRRNDSSIVDCLLPCQTCKLESLLAGGQVYWRRNNMRLEETL